MNLHGHPIAKLDRGSRLFDMQYAWVCGYILALEDILKNLDGLWSPSVYEAGIRSEINNTLNQAHATLKELDKVNTWKEFSGNLEPENQPTTEDES